MPALLFDAFYIVKIHVQVCALLLCKPDPLVVDLSSHVVAITSGFHGANLLLFGSVEGEGDVVVVIRGPSQNELIRRRRCVSDRRLCRDLFLAASTE